MKDYSTARHWAISGIGYGKGFSEQEAIDNYVATQERNWSHMQYSGESKDLATALREGDLRPVTYLAPEGVDGFVSDGVIRWTQDGKVVRTATDDDVINNPHWQG